MAYTATALQPAGSGFAVNAVTDDASGCEELVAAPGSGKKLVLRQVIISCVAAITITIGAGETGGAVTSPILGPVTFAATSPVAIFNFIRGIVLVANTALTVDASGAGAFTCFVIGDVE